jgi:hypothetical protein
MAGGALVVSGERMAAIVYAQGYNPKPTDGSALVLSRERGVNTVRELRLTDIGVVLYYAPRHPKHLTAAEERQIAQIVPVASGTGR